MVKMYMPDFILEFYQAFFVMSIKNASLNRLNEDPCVTPPVPKHNAIFDQWIFA